jgi:hypothetical protein
LRWRLRTLYTLRIQPQGDPAMAEPITLEVFSDYV